MKTSRERNILIAVLSVAGLGLGIDRFVIGSEVTGPSQSSASVIGELDAESAGWLAVPDTESIKSTGADEAPGVSFAERLRLIADSSAGTDPGQSRDAFAPGPGWEVTDIEVGGVPDNQARQIAEDFRSKHLLEAVLVSGDKRYAVIGGQTLFIGQKLDGYRLQAVLERSAVFEGRGIRVELRIKTDFPSS